MARIIAINRKYFTLTLSALLICFLGIAGVTIWKTAIASTTKTNMVPDVKMLGIAVEPASFSQDITYGSVTLKGSQIITNKTFDLIVTVQNSTAQAMSNIPVELEISLVGDPSKKVSKLGNLPSLDPGATARVAFRQVKALGDAQGKSATAGQHQISLRIKPNAAGGVNQATEATFYFNVDTTVKAPKATASTPQSN